MKKLIIIFATLTILTCCTQHRYLERLETRTAEAPYVNLLLEENKSTYIDICKKYRRAYSPVYVARNPGGRAMNTVEFKFFSEMLWQVEHDLKFPPGTLMATAIMESSLHIHSRGICEESGIFQIMDRNWAWLHFLSRHYKYELPGYMDFETSTVPDYVSDNELFMAHYATLRSLEYQIKGVAITIFRNREWFDNDWNYIALAYRFGGDEVYKWWRKDYIPPTVSYIYSHDGRVRTFITEKYLNTFRALQQSFMYGFTGPGYWHVNDFEATIEQIRAYERAESEYLNMRRTVDKFERQLFNAEERLELSLAEVEALKARIAEARPATDAYIYLCREYVNTVDKTKEQEDAFAEMEKSYKHLMSILGEE